MNNKFYLLFTYILTQFFAFSYAGDWECVYLPSFPRSGSHWARYLVEEATGIATSSVYRDPDPQHLEEKFPWNAYCCDHGYEGNCRYPSITDRVVIKTHYPAIKSKKPILKKRSANPTKCIRIVRHPIDCFYSWYIYRKRPPKPENEKPFNEFISLYCDLWAKFQNYWDKQPNVHTIYYEDMMKDPFKALKEILDILGYEYRKRDIKRAIAKYPPEGEFLKHLKHYSFEDLELMNSKLSEVLELHKYTIPVVNN